MDRSVLTEGLAWLVTGLNMGYGAGSAIVGHVADAHGARAGFLVAIAAGLLVAATALTLHARLAKTPPSGPADEQSHPTGTHETAACCAS